MDQLNMATTPKTPTTSRRSSFGMGESPNTQQKRLVREIDSLKEQLSEARFNQIMDGGAKDQVVTLTASLEDKEEKLKNLAAEVEEKNAKEKTLQEELQQSRSLVHENVSRIEKLESLVESIKQNLTEKERQASQLADTKQELEQKLETVNKQSEEYKSQIQDMASQMASIGDVNFEASGASSVLPGNQYEEELRTLQAKLKEAEEAVIASKRDKRDYQHQLDSKEIKRAKEAAIHAKELEELQTKMDELQGKLVAKDETIGKLQDDLDNLNATNNSLVKQTSAKESSLSGKIAELQDKLVLQQTEIQQQQSLALASQQQLSESQSKQQDISVVEAELSASKAAVKQLKEKCNGLQDMLELKDRRIEVLQEQLDTETTTSANKSERLRETEIQLKDALERQQLLEQQVTDVKEELSISIEELSTAKTQLASKLANEEQLGLKRQATITHQDSEIARLEAAVNASTSSQKHLQTELHVKETLIATLRDQLRTAEDTNDAIKDLQKEIETLRKRNVELAATVTDAKEHLNAQEKRYETKIHALKKELKSHDDDPGHGRAANDDIPVVTINSVDDQVKNIGDSHDTPRRLKPRRVVSIPSAPDSVGIDPLASQAIEPRASSKNGTPKRKHHGIAESFTPGKSVSSPRGKKNKKKKMTIDVSDSETDPSDNEHVRVCIALSGFNDKTKTAGNMDMRVHLTELADGLQAEVYKKSDFSDSVTHVISKPPFRTIKCIGAALQGRWICRPEWLEDSHAAGQWLPEENYGIRFTSNPFKGRVFLLSDKFFSGDGAKKLPIARQIIERHSKGKIVQTRKGRQPENYDFAIVLPGDEPESVDAQVLDWKSFLAMIPGYEFTESEMPHPKRKTALAPRPSLRSSQSQSQEDPKPSSGVAVDKSFLSPSNTKQKKRSLSRKKLGDVGNKRVKT